MAIDRIVVDKAEFGTDQDGLEVGHCGETIHNGLVFTMAFSPEFMHGSEDGHLAGHGKTAEVVDSRFHT